MYMWPLRVDLADQTIVNIYFLSAWTRPVITEWMTKRRYKTRNTVSTVQPIAGTSK